MNIIKHLFNYVEKLIKGSSKRKLIENAIILIIIGIILVVAGGSFSTKNEPKDTNKEKSSDAQYVSKIISAEDKDDLTKKVESILSKINGVGSINAMITYSSGTEIVPVYDIKKANNDTSEKDTNGGTRNVKTLDEDKKIAYEETNGSKKPIIIKELHPPVKGVVVVADGANDPQIKENISRAVQVLLDVPAHKIQIFSKK